MRRHEAQGTVCLLRKGNTDKTQTPRQRTIAPAAG